MKTKPILFSTPMVQALLEGRKTQTRRICKPQPAWNKHGDVFIWKNSGGSGETITRHLMELNNPYGKPSDLLIPAMRIPNVPKIYCADTQGNIWSKARGEWRPLRPFIPKAQKCYASVTICLDGRKTTRNVHKLICSAFYPEPKARRMQVRHLDGNSLNNAPENLTWGTQAENYMDRKAHGNGMEGEKHHAAKFSDIEREHIRWCIENGVCSQKHLARVLGVSQSTICFMMDAKEKRIAEQEESNWASRLTLEITDIRIERLQDISEEDCVKEGVEIALEDFAKGGFNCKGDKYIMPTKAKYRHLWQSINGEGSWNANPWVWVVEFSVHKCNVDDFLRRVNRI